MPPVIPTINDMGSLQRQLNAAFAALSAAGSPGGSSGQVQYNDSGAFGGFTIGGDGTLNVGSGALTITKSNGVAFGSAAFVNTGTSGGTVPLLNGVNTFSNTNIFGDSSSPAAVFMNGAAATVRGQYYLTGGSSRWLVGADNTAESSTATGTNFNISRYNNSGVFIDTSLEIERASGQVIMAAERLTPATAPGNPATGWVLYVDSGDGNKLKAKASTGTVVTLGTP